MTMGSAKESDSSGMTEAASDIEAEAQRQETALLYNNVGIAQAVTILIASLVGYVDATLHATTTETFVWWCVVVMLSAGRYELGRRFQASPQDAATAPRWRLLYVVGTALIGAAWGFGTTWVLWDAPDRAVLFTSLVLGGMVAGAVPILAPVPAAFWAFAPLVCLPITVRIFLQASAPLHWAFGSMCLIFLVAMLASARFLHRRLDAAIRLGLELRRTNEELKLTLESLRLTQRHLVESGKMAALGGLVAGIAHEINTPVGVGVTAASALEDETRRLAALYQQGQMKKTDLEQFIALSEQSSRMILNNLERAADLIQSFKQVAVDQSSVIRRRFKVCDYLEDILTSLRPALNKKGVGCAIDCGADIEIESYPGVLSQIVTNLVINALTHAFEEKSGQIRIAVAKREQRLEIQFSDDGKGMSAEVLARIFDPFFTTKRSAGGSGLGLHIVYNLVTQTLKGSIECRSSPGDGTSFSISWPVSD